MCKTRIDWTTEDFTKDKRNMDKRKGKKTCRQLDWNRLLTLRITDQESAQGNAQKGRAVQ